MKHFLFCLLFLAGTIARAQSTFEKTFGGSGDEKGNDIIQTSDGGFAVAGYTHSFGAGGNDAYILRLDTGANLLWTKVIGLSGDETLSSIVQTDDGDFIAIGTTTSFRAGGAPDIFAVHLDSSGNLLWSKAFGGNHYEYGSKIIKCPGGYMICGSTVSYSGWSVFNAYILKIDEDGNTLWNKVIGSSWHQSAYSIKPTSDGNFVLTGYISYSIYQEVSVLKITSTGDVLWSKRIHNTDESAGVDIIQTHDGGYAIAGHKAGPVAGQWDGYVMKLDASGNLLWTRTAGGPSYDAFTSIRETSDGDLYAVGNIQGGLGFGAMDIYLLKLDSNGVVLWNKMLGGSQGESMYNMIPLSGGGYALAGYTSSYGAGSNDVFVMTLDDFGQGCGPDTSGGTYSTAGAIFDVSYSVHNGDSVVDGGQDTTGGIQTDVCEALSIKLFHHEKSSLFSLSRLMATSRSPFRRTLKIPGRSVLKYST